MRFITSFALIDGQCIAVLDTGETEEELSHLGEPWFAARPAGPGVGRRELRANVLTADEFGVWVTGMAPVCDASGAVVAAVTVDLPAVEAVGLQAVPHRSLARSGRHAAGGGRALQPG